MSAPMTGAAWTSLFTERRRCAAMPHFCRPDTGGPPAALRCCTRCSRDWAFSKQTLQAVDNRAQVQVALRQPMGAFHEISYQLYNGSEILPSAFEARDDRFAGRRAPRSRN